MDKFFDRVAAMWAVFMGYVQGVAQNWAEGKKPRAVGKIVLPLVPVALVIALAAFLWIKRAVIVKGLFGDRIFSDRYFCLYTRKRQRKGKDAKRRRDNETRQTGA